MTGDDPRVGAVLADRYRIVAPLGKGGAGMVYVARHLHLNEDVAIKFLRPFWKDSHEQRTRFRREAVALSRLRHPGVVSVLDFGQQDAGLHVMELVSGERFPPGSGTRGLYRARPSVPSSIIPKPRRRTPPIIHRDMKPENVMVLSPQTARSGSRSSTSACPRGARRTTPLTRRARSTGHRRTCPPSNAAAKTWAPPTSTPWASCSTKPSRGGRRSTAPAPCLAQHMFVEPISLASHQPTVPIEAGLDAVVRRALAKSAEERPTAAEFRDILGAALRGTDPVSLSAQAARARTAASGLSREERAITGVRGVHPPAPEVQPRDVLVWSGDPAYGERLRVALATHGVRAAVHAAAEAPDRERPFDALVVDVREGLDRALSLRSAPEADDTRVVPLSPPRCPRRAF